MSKGIVDRDPLPPWYSRGDQVVHDRLCVLAPLGCPSPRASQVHPGRKQRRFIYRTCSSTCPQHAMYERCANNQHLQLHHQRVLGERLCCCVLLLLCNGHNISEIVETHLWSRETMRALKVEKQDYF